MRIVADDLDVLKRVALRRASRLRMIAAGCLLASSVNPDREARVTYCVIELHTLWDDFCRALFLSSALAARDSSGQRVAVTATPRPKSVDEALTYAIRRNKPGLFKQKQAAPWSWWDEPTWGRSQVLLNSLDEVGCSNGPKVAAALSTQTAVFDYLAMVRNFYAHRGKVTRERLHPMAVTYSLPPDLHPSGALLLRARLGGVLRPQPLLLDWVDDVINTLSLVA